MKKTKPIYLFAVLLSLFIMAGAASIVLIAFDVSIVFLIIIIALIIVFFLFSANYLSSGQLEKKMEIFKECYNCKKEVKVNAKYCEHCGVNLDEDIVCDYCGVNNPFDSEICINCGANLK